jgi:hypothetical protein
MIRSHERDAEWVIARGGKVHEPRRLEDDLEAEPPDIEVATFGARVRHDDRVEIFDVHAALSP